MKKQGDNREVIGNFVELRFVNLPSSSFMRGKVDTGATISSLHCDSHSIDEKTNQISFDCRVLSPNTITMPLVDKQAVKSSDGGTEYRPVITLSVKIGDDVIDNVKFNLNDRSNMDAPILIGQNLIKAGNFLIDPSSVSEAVELEKDLDNDVEIDATEEENSVISIEELFKILQKADISFADLITYATSNTITDTTKKDTHATDEQLPPKDPLP